MHVWDVEVLYAIRGLFRECVQEVKVEFGVGSVGEVSLFVFCVFLFFLLVLRGCGFGRFPMALVLPFKGAMLSRGSDVS